MFELFTFGASAQKTCHNLPLQEEEAFPSPTDTSCALLPPPTSYPFSQQQEELGDIVNQFSQYTLQSNSYTPSFDLEEALKTWHTSLVVDDEEMDQEMTTSGEHITRVISELQPLPMISSRETLACRRLQRQINAQMQINTAHIRDISSLVEDMISTSSQCTLRHPPSTDTSTNDFIISPATNQPHDVVIEPFVCEDRPITPDCTDEGFHEDLGFEEKNFSLRRASTPSRIRKEPLRYWASSEYVVNRSRVVVRRLPRMRKRNVKAPASVAE